MPRHDDPAELNPEERLDELVRIFATALLRLPPRTRAAISASSVRPQQSACHEHQHDGGAQVDLEQAPFHARRCSSRRRAGQGARCNGLQLVRDGITLVAGPISDRPKILWVEFHA